MKYLVLPIVSASLILSACAKRPESIAAVDMDTQTYQNLSCKSLLQEQTKIRNELEALSAQQNSAADSDALGVFLLGIPWSSMSGGDREALIAVAKGRVNAIEAVQVQKDCM